METLESGSVIQPPDNFPANQTLRQQQYSLKNLFSEDILFYNIAFYGENSAIVAELGHASYPPDMPPL
ncbi:MAG TPA: hypothetical protein VLL97_13895, partial [Acidobacteriota bacterium]|nr:hypothetical protein [Acidobacteriota bacterium]